MKKVLSLMLIVCFASSSSLAQTASEQKFNERYGLWFAFESTCSPCLKFAPTLYQFVTKHDLYLQAISKDARPLRSWPGPWAKNENAILYRLGIEEYPTPTLLLFDSHSGERMLIGVGLMTEEQLKTRIYELTNIALGDVQ